MNSIATQPSNLEASFIILLILIGDALSTHNGQKFATLDRDHNNCANVFKGAWWYKNCLSSNLNGHYLNGRFPGYSKGVVWSTWLGFDYSLKATSMKFRRI